MAESYEESSDESLDESYEESLGESLGEVIENISGLDLDISYGIGDLGDEELADGDVGDGDLADYAHGGYISGEDEDVDALIDELRAEMAAEMKEFDEKVAQEMLAMEAEGQEVEEDEPDSQDEMIAGLEGLCKDDSWVTRLLAEAVDGDAPYNGQVVVEEGNTSVVKEITLLEAFDQEVESQQKQIKERIGLSDVHGSPRGIGLPQGFSPAREKDVAAALAGIRVDEKIHRKGRDLTNEANAAISNFTKAEALADYTNQAGARLMEMTKRAVSRMPTDVDEEKEAGVPVGPKYPKFEVFEIGAADSMKPLEIISYIGSTRSKID
ncbi:uncharacterized protein LOC131678406 [Topomyia yanbarensis]|uniref:uncharacterized protein LOC131678406 n=1 Tax=Topomyia yanbarensis TaxID=2498891 RepID=UPI00273AC78A|nr:uncharacterized protein LOC131678406 [Topomyia yanbarensis]